MLFQHNSPSPSPSPSTIFREVASNQLVVDAISESLLSGELVAYQDKGPHQVAVHQGLMAFLKCAESLGTNLVGSLGWRRRDSLGHPRYYSPEGLFSQDVCVIFCRGKFIDEGPLNSYFRIRPKGERWKELLNQNTVVRQRSLFEDIEGGTRFSTGKPYTVCAVPCVIGDHLQIYLADPLQVITSKGKHEEMKTAKLFVSDRELIFDDSLSGIVENRRLNMESREGPVITDFFLEENEDVA